MTVIQPELKSFVTQFADLWHPDRNACLSVKCEAGQATINLQLCLGSHPLQHQQVTTHRQVCLTFIEEQDVSRPGVWQLIKLLQ